MAQDLLTDDALRERLVAEASEHVLLFDWAEVARETVGVYERLVAARAAPRDDRVSGGAGREVRSRRRMWRGDETSPKRLGRGCRNLVHSC